MKQGLMFKFGKASIRRMKGVNDLLVMVAQRALSMSTIDMTIPWMGGVRTAEEQNAIFKKGYSQRDGYTKKSYHQSGEALDIAPYKNGLADNKKNSLVVSYHIKKAFDELADEGVIPSNLYLHQGIYWGDKDLDNDGFLTEQDKLGWDARHIELRPYPQKNVYEIKI